MSEPHKEHHKEHSGETVKAQSAVLVAEQPKGNAKEHTKEHLDPHHKKHNYPIINEKVLDKRSQKKYHVPVIGHFADKSVLFNSILDAEKATGINYTMIFEACVGKIFKAKNVLWEFAKGNHYIKYKAYYINAHQSYKRTGGFNG
jgi:predicted glycoside hydrolase/deacetylase ChbG (UPF0249 family)